MPDDRDATSGHGLNAYISYSHADGKDVARLKTHLRSVSWADKRIDFWADAEITPGRQWYDAISDAIERADVFVTCLSADYLASEFRYEVEWPSIMRRARASGALLVPVILRPCMWFGYVDVFPAVPTDTAGRVRPISEWRPREAGFHRAALQISEAIHQHFQSPGGPRVSAAEVELPALHKVPFAPAGSEKLSPADIDAAVKAIRGRRTVKGGA